MGGSKITEDKVIEISKAQDLSVYTHDELRKADEWIKLFALNALSSRLKQAGISKPVKEYVELMARCHYGSVETDKFLQVTKCYPAWLQESAA